MSSPRKEYFVYILTNWQHSVLYTGVTGNIVERLEQHIAGTGSVFTKKYKAHKLVYLERFYSIHQAIDWEKTIKAGSRKRKVALIEEQNSDWVDFGETL